MPTPQLVAPLFPLPDVTLFPRTLLPLHVFEARYRAMVMDALERDRRICVVRLRPGFEACYDGKPAVHAVGGLGEIASWERLPNGRYNLLLRGEARVGLEGEVPSDTLYRLARLRRLDDVPAADDCAPALARVRAACSALLAALERPLDLLDTALAPGQRPGVVADRVAAAVLPDGALRQALLETVDEGVRVRRVAEAVAALVRALKGGHS